MRLGLRIDVDTYRGTRVGVPNLCRLLAEQGIRATFFFSVGPDNMGRHVYRLLRPSFLKKMLRSKAASLYGWDILFRGTVLPGPIIGEKLGSVISAAARAGHEIGFHAWDHHHWQTHIDTMAAKEIKQSIDRGFTLLTRITGSPPVCSAVPAWKCNKTVLVAQSGFPFNYSSDCRGSHIFRPVAGERVLDQIQIPVTLPTYDEVVGRNGISDQNYNRYLLSCLAPERLNVLAIHAEVEGIAKYHLFKSFLKNAIEKGVLFAPLGDLTSSADNIPAGRIRKTRISGREGWVSSQEVPVP